MPKVSIIVPCYLQGQYLNECLTSVINQTFTDWECIIVDDGSPDNTADVAKEFVEKDNRFIYKKYNNAGVSTARNNGIKAASGNLILPLDGDDTIHKNYLERAVNIFNNDPNTTLVYCQAQFFGEKNEHWELPLFSYKRLLRENIIFCCCMFYKEKALAVGLYNESMHIGLEDWEFLLRLLDENSNVVRIDEILFNYRIKKQSRNIDINTSKLEKIKVHKLIYDQHKTTYEKYYGSYIDLIQEKETLKETIEIYKKIMPSRNLKNLIKFFKKEQMFKF